MKSAERTTWYVEKWRFWFQLAVARVYLVMAVISLLYGFMRDLPGFYLLGGFSLLIGLCYWWRVGFVMRFKDIYEKEE